MCVCVCACEGGGGGGAKGVKEVGKKWKKRVFVHQKSRYVEYVKSVLAI